MGKKGEKQKNSELSPAHPFRNVRFSGAGWGQNIKEGRSGAVEIKRRGGGSGGIRKTGAVVGGWLGYKCQRKNHIPFRPPPIGARNQTPHGEGPPEGREPTGEGRGRESGRGRAHRRNTPQRTLKKVRRSCSEKGSASEQGPLTATEQVEGGRRWWWWWWWGF